MSRTPRELIDDLDRTYDVHGLYALDDWRAELHGAQAIRALRDLVPLACSLAHELDALDKRLTARAIREEREGGRSLFEQAQNDLDSVIAAARGIKQEA